MLAAVFPVAAMARTPEISAPGGNRAQTGTVGTASRLVTGNMAGQGINDVPWLTAIGSGTLYSANPTAAKGLRHIAAVPVITAVSPSPSGLGQVITLTGTDLGTATNVTVNGVSGFYTITNNTATSITFRVPTTTPATGAGVVVTTAGGISNSFAFTLMPAPGNALDFVKGTFNVVKVLQPFTGDFTIEFWMNTTTAGGAGTLWYSGVGLVDAEQTGQKADFGVSLVGSKVAFGIGNTNVVNTSTAAIQNPTILSATAVTDGRWHHVAATRAVSGAVCTMNLYIDGILEATTTNNAIAPRNTVVYTGLAIGQILSGSATSTTAFYNGRLDEVRLWTVARTGSDVQNNYRSVLAGPQLNLAAYYNFDGGTPSGSNAGLNTLFDIANPVNFVPVFGAMTGFALTGATSNWEESYAMVVPTATTATGVSSTSFTANWTAPAVGVVTNYLLDVSTVATFASVITGSPFTVASPTLTKTVTGLAAGTYYYRVHADKTTTPATQGGASNIITTVPSSVATLGTLTMSAGPLAPTFAAGTSTYSFTTSASTTTVTPTLTTGAATPGNPSPGTITVNGTNVPSGTTSGAIPLVVGTNTITVLGTAQDGVSTSSYTVTVTRCSFQAIAKSITVALDATGSVATTVTAATIDNGSTVGCATSPGTASTLALTTPTITCTDATPAATINKSLTLTGTQFVDGTHPLLPQGNAARTIEAWVYPTVSTTNYALIFNYGSPSPNLRSGLAIYNGRLVYTAEFNDVYSGTLLALNVWHHVAATYDGTTLKLYIDGVLDLTNTPTAFATAGLGWRIGQRVAPVTAGENLTGRVDEVRVWNRPLTAAEIASSAGRANPASLLGLLARWNLDEGTGTVVNDVTGNSTAGTLSSSTTWNTSGVPYQGVMANLTLTDASGTVSRAQSTVTVQDNTAPTAIARTNVVVAASTTGRVYVAPSAVNNASSDNCAVTTMALSASTFGDCGASSALVLDGGGGYVALPALAALATNFTFEAWVNYLDNGQWARVMDFGSGTTSFLFLSPRAGSDLLRFAIQSGATYEEINGPAMPTGWNHLAVTLSKNPSTNAVTGIMYLNGTAVSTNTAMTLTPAALGTSPNIWLGRSQFPDPYFKGQLDEVRVWSTARTATEINLYKDKSVDGTTAGLLAYYDLNDGAGSTTASSRGSVTGVGTLSTATPAGASTAGALPTFAGPGQVPAMSAVGPQTVTLTMTDRVGNVSTATTTVTVTPPTAITWTGAISTDWTDCRNWTYGKVPDAATSITIPTGMPFYPNLGTGTFSVQNLTVNSGGTLTVASGTTLQVSGNFTNNGTATLPGTVAFVGGATQTIGGSTATSFSALTVNNTATTGTVQLTADLPVTTALAFTAGTLTTGTYKVALGSTATLSGESNTSYLIGNVELTHTLATAGTADNFGSLGLTLTPNSSSTALPGSTLVRRVTGTPATGVGGNTGVSRYFVITPTVNTGLNVAMDFAYFNHELNSIPAANLAIFKTASGTTGPWAIQRPATLATNLVSVAGITDFSVWTLGNTAAPLPVELSAFTANAEGSATVRLAWATATEKNSAAFGVERSTNGETFSTIGTVPATGNSTAAQTYTLTDQHLPTAVTTLYYRLHLVDADGTAVYSPVRAVALFRTHEEPAVALFPNPAHSAVTLNGTLPGTRVQVLDALGRQVTAATADAAGTATLLLPQGLPQGMYVVRAGSKAVRLAVE